MKKFKLLSLLLTIALVLAAIPFAAIAGSIPTIENADELISAAAEGGEYNLNSYIDLSAPLIVEKDLTLNLNETGISSIYSSEGHSFTDNGGLFEVSGATLTLNGFGSVYHYNSGSAFKVTGVEGKTTKVILNNCNTYMNVGENEISPSAFFSVSCPEGAAAPEIIMQDITEEGNPLYLNAEGLTNVPFIKGDGAKAELINVDYINTGALVLGNNNSFTVGKYCYWSPDMLPDILFIGDNNNIIFDSGEDVNGNDLGSKVSLLSGNNNKLTLLCGGFAGTGSLVTGNDNEIKINVQYNNIAYDNALVSGQRNSITIEGGSIGKYDAYMPALLSGSENEMTISGGVYYINDFLAEANAGTLNIRGGDGFSVNPTEYLVEGVLTYQNFDGLYTTLTLASSVSDEFKALFPDNKYTFNSVPPKSEDDITVLANDFFMNEDYWDATMETNLFNEDYSKCVFGLYRENSETEYHYVDIAWNYDPKVKEIADTFIESFPKDIKYYNVADLELINYFVNGGLELEDGSATLANYSSELKSYINNTNFNLKIEAHAGFNEPFITGTMGIARLMHNGAVYYANTDLGAKGNHAIIVPTATGDGADQLIAAAQKRIDDYIGAGKVKVTLKETIAQYKANIVAKANKTLAEKQALYENYAATHRNDDAWNNANNDYIFIQEQLTSVQNNIIDLENSIAEWELNDPEGNAESIADARRQIAELNAEISNLEQQAQEKQDIIAAEDNKPIFDYSEYWELEEAVNGALADLDRYSSADFAEDDDLAFMNDAAGGYIFNLEINNNTYSFVILKDDTKLDVPAYASVDINTNVEIKTGSSEVPLDTNLRVAMLTEGDEYNRVIGKLDVEDNSTYDITLYSETARDYITSLDNGKFRVKLPVPASLENKTLAVYYVASTGKITEYNVTVSGGFATFETDHFSVYTLSEKTVVINNQGLYDENDLKALRKHLLKDVSEGAVDANGDGRVNICDLLYIKRQLKNSATA